MEPSDRLITKMPVIKCNADIKHTFLVVYSYSLSMKFNRKIQVPSDKGEGQNLCLF